jgi:hypothetical protein
VDELRGRTTRGAVAARHVARRLAPQGGAQLIDPGTEVASGNRDRHDSGRKVVGAEPVGEQLTHWPYAVLAVDQTVGTGVLHQDLAATSTGREASLELVGGRDCQHALASVALDAKASDHPDLGACAEPMAGIFDVAAGHHHAVVEQHRRADLELRIRGVGKRRCCRGRRP